MESIVEIIILGAVGIFCLSVAIFVLWMCIYSIFFM